MKKLNKQKINPEELIKDTDQLLNLVSSLENMDLETIDLEKLEIEVNSIEKNIKEKYKDILWTKNLEKYLDIEE